MAYVGYPVAYVDYPVAYVDYPVAYVEYPVAFLMENSFWAKTGRRGSSWTFSIMNP